MFVLRCHLGQIIRHSTNSFVALQAAQRNPAPVQNHIARLRISNLCVSAGHVAPRRNDIRSSVFHPWHRGPTQPPFPTQPHVLGVTAAAKWALLVKIERFASHHHEVREALVLSVAGVTAIMLIESLILLILY
jgi:hypothetical protein